MVAAALVAGCTPVGEGPETPRAVEVEEKATPGELIPERGRVATRTEPMGSPTREPELERAPAMSTCRTVMDALRGQYCATGCACEPECFAPDEEFADGHTPVPVHPLPPSCWCFGDDSVERWCDALFEGRAIGRADQREVDACVDAIRVRRGKEPQCHAEDMLEALADSEDQPAFKCNAACDAIGVVDSCVQEPERCPLFSEG